MSHWTQRASKANIRWLKATIQKQESEYLGLKRFFSLAITERGISKEKLLVYLEALESEGLIIIDHKTQEIQKLVVSVSENTESQSKII